MGFSVDLGDFLCHVSIAKKNLPLIVIHTAGTKKWFLVSSVQEEIRLHHSCCCRTAQKKCSSFLKTLQKIH